MKVNGGIKIAIIWHGYISHQLLFIMSILQQYGIYISVDVYDSYGWLSTWTWEGWYSNKGIYMQEIWWYNIHEDDFSFSFFKNAIGKDIINNRKKMCYTNIFDGCTNVTHASLVKHCQYIQNKFQYEKYCTFYLYTPITKISSSKEKVSLESSVGKRQYDYVISTWMKPFHTSNSMNIMNSQDIRQKLVQLKKLNWPIKNKSIYLVGDWLTCGSIFAEIYTQYIQNNKIHWLHKYPIRAMDNDPDINKFFRFSYENYKDRSHMSLDERNNIHIRWNWWWVRKNVIDIIHKNHPNMYLEKINDYSIAPFWSDEDIIIYADWLNRLHILDLLSTWSTYDEYLLNKKQYGKKMEEHMASNYTLNIPWHERIFFPQMSKLLFAWFPVFRSSFLCAELIILSILHGDNIICDTLQS